MKHTVLFLALSLLISACGDKTNKVSGSKDSTATSGGTAQSSTSTSSSTETASGTDSKMFEVESGIVEMKNSMMDGMKHTLYFDDYGTRQAIHTTMEMKGQKMENVQIKADGWDINYDPGKKSGTKTKMAAPEMSLIGDVPSNPDKMTDEQKRKYDYKELETRQFAGKEAKGFSVNDQGTGYKVWTWNGVPLHVEMTLEKGQPITMEVTSIQTDVDIPADKFTVPSDVKLQETSATMPPMPK